eukprot:499686-Hanusia_phi.AAC.1
MTVTPRLTATSLSNERRTWHHGKEPGQRSSDTPWYGRQPWALTRRLSGTAANARLHRLPSPPGPGQPVTVTVTAAARDHETRSDCGPGPGSCSEIWH